MSITTVNYDKENGGKSVCVCGGGGCDERPSILGS